MMGATTFTLTTGMTIAPSLDAINRVYNNMYIRYQNMKAYAVAPMPNESFVLDILNNKIPTLNRQFQMKQISISDYANQVGNYFRQVDPLLSQVEAATPIDGETSDILAAVPALDSTTIVVPGVAAPPLSPLQNVLAIPNTTPTQGQGQGVSPRPAAVQKPGTDISGAISSIFGGANSAIATYFNAKTAQQMSRNPALMNRNAQNQIPQLQPSGGTNWTPWIIGGVALLVVGGVFVGITRKGR